MPHTLNPSVPITLDKERSLLYGAAAFIEFKEATGRDLLETFRELSGPKYRATITVEDADGEKELPNPDFELPVKVVRDILWAGLIHEDENLTLKQVSNMFTPGTMKNIIPLVAKAFTLGLGDQKADEERPRRAPANTKRSTGATSGASVAVISA